jgi:hypothetical protein
VSSRVTQSRLHHPLMGRGERRRTLNVTTITLGLGAPDVSSDIMVWHEHAAMSQEPPSPVQSACFAWCWLMTFNLISCDALTYAVAYTAPCNRGGSLQKMTLEQDIYYVVPRPLYTTWLQRPPLPRTCSISLNFVFYRSQVFFHDSRKCIDTGSSSHRTVVYCRC